MTFSKSLFFIFKISLVYGFLAFVFSLIGIFLPYSYTPNDPLVSLSVEHVLGHIFLGMIVGAVSLNLRYFFISGIFAILLDSDHFINFFPIESVSRMDHSFPFAIFAFITLLLIFGKRNFLLGGVAAAAVMSHISFDILLSRGDNFRLFLPFSEQFITFNENDWLIFLLVSISIVITSLLIEKLIKKN